MLQSSLKFKCFHVESYFIIWRYQRACLVWGLSYKLLSKMVHMLTVGLRRSACSWRYDCLMGQRIVPDASNRLNDDTNQEWSFFKFWDLICPIDFRFIFYYGYNAWFAIYFFTQVSFWREEAVALWGSFPAYGPLLRGFCVNLTFHCWLNIFLRVSLTQLVLFRTNAIVYSKEYTCLI